MYNQGWIKLHRQLLDSLVFANQTALKIWIWCLLKASRKERFIPLKIGKGNITIKIFPGQFIFGRHAAEAELNIDGSTIYRWIKKFESDEFCMISVEANNQYSVISICNWVNYQFDKTDDEQPMSNQRARHEPDMNTDNTVNTVNTVKNTSSIIFAAFRDAYPGNKGGFEVEFENFIKKNTRNYSEIVTLLLPSLEIEKSHRAKSAELKEWVPKWKNLSTWINNKCWEQEFSEIKTDSQFPDRPPKPSPYHTDWHESDLSWHYSPIH